MNKKYKVVLSKQVKDKLKKVSKKDKKMLENDFEKIAKNPKLGKPMNNSIVIPWKNEKCKSCKKTLSIFLDKNSKEVFFSCVNVKCKNPIDFWCTLKEFEVGRKEFMIDKLELNEKEKNIVKKMKWDKIIHLIPKK